MLKLNAGRIERVTAVQDLLEQAAERLDGLARDEQHGWTPGSPASERTHRVRPLRDMEAQVLRMRADIERLYS